MATDELTERQLAILAYEREVENRRPFAKDADVRSRFGVPAARYFQELYAFLDSPAALAHDPQLVHRLQRLRDQRVRSRARRTFKRDASTDAA